MSEAFYMFAFLGVLMMGINVGIAIEQGREARRRTATGAFANPYFIPPTAGDPQ